MIDFIYKFNDALSTWQPGAKWSLRQISEATETSLPHVLQFLSEGLGKDIDVAGCLSLDEATEAVLLLSKRLKSEIEAREKQMALRRKKIQGTYYKLLEKVNVMEVAKNWHGAFRTLSYFAGQHENDLSNDTLVALCSSIMRAGIKSNANVQELGHWLQKGVAVSMSNHTKEGMEEALDLIDAYGDHFQQETSDKGSLILGNILAIIEEPAARFELWEQYKELVNQLYATSTK